jgi:hypothetical protein
LTFKYLKKKVILVITSQQIKLFEELLNKPFCILGVQQHKQEDIKTNGNCCFNHIIGLSQKNAADKSLYGYNKIIFDSLSLSSSDSQNGNTNPSNKHLWIKNDDGKT